MLYTIVQIIAFQALFLLVYDLFLKRETFFNYNRAYLLLTSVLSLALPFIKFPELKKIAAKEFVIQLPEVFIGTKPPTEYEILVAEQAGIVIKQPQTPLWLVILYCGIVVATIIFLIKMSKLFWLKYNNPKRWYGNVLIVALVKSSAAFSFFNTIFLGERIPESEKTTVYKHELIHVKEKHSIDLLFFEILKILFWFNPLAYMYQNRIKELHEFIADAKAVKQNGKADYYQSLLNQVFDVYNVSFTNTFFKKSLIKKRIAMLQKSKSKQQHLMKYALLIPLVFGMLIYTSTEIKAQEKTETQQEVSQELTDEELIEKYYQELMKMKKDGVPFLEIAKYSGITERPYDKYIVSREEYLKTKAYLKYLANDMIARKSDNGTLTQKDMETAELMRLEPHKSYAEYREWAKTKEAKDLWEANIRDGELKLFVEDILNKTADEERRYNAMLDQLENDNTVEKVIITDGKSTLILDDYKSNKTDKNQIQSVEVPFSVIEEVPTLVECKDLATNEDRKYCLSNYIQKHVSKNFNKAIADTLNLEGRQRIFVSFKIDKMGDISSVQARAAHPALEEEAKRVIKSLPRFIPGKQKGKAVVVPYSLPIVFQATNGSPKTQSIKKDSIENTPKYKAFIERLKETDALPDDRDEQFEMYKMYIIDSLIQVEQEYLKSNRHKLNKNDNVPYSVIEVAPIHPQCKTISSEEERKKCTSAEVQKFVSKNFNTKLPDKLGLSKGQKRIFIQFVINEIGQIVNVGARGPHPDLEAEAIRVINLLPQFTPGKQKGENIKVAFSLPITFQVND